MKTHELFLELAQPDADGFSRWVYRTEFTGRYAPLLTNNGGSWSRGSSALCKMFNVEKKRDMSPGRTIDAIRLCGFRNEEVFSQTIRQDIREAILRQRCVMLGVKGNSENTRIEVDHKDGRKNDARVSDPATQSIDDFQPLCKAANDIKRQICKHCKETDERWDATNILGNPYPFYEGDKQYKDELGCRGCYQYDPVAYRKCSVRRLITEASENTAEFIMKKLYHDEE